MSDRKPPVPRAKHAVDPVVAAAFNAANAAFRAGQWGEAQAKAEQAIAADPKLVQAHVLLARAVRALGDLAAAKQAFDGALAVDPRQFDALLERGNVLRALADPAAAAADYRAAMAARPDDTRPALALARLEEERAQEATDPSERKAAEERAAIAFQRALDRAARVAEPAHAIGTLWQDIARYRLARADLPRVLDALRHARIYAEGAGAAARVDLDMAEVFLRLGMTAEAQAMMERLSAHDDRDLLRALAQLAYRFNFWAEAVEILKRAAGLAADDPQIWLDLSDMQAKSYLLEDALASLDRAEAVGASGDFPVALRASIANRIGDNRTALDLYDKLFADGHKGFASSAAMSLLYADHLSPQEVASRHRALFADWGAGARDRGSFGADPNPNRPLRVGMVTADLHHQHPVNIFLQPMLARWDHARLPLTVYFTGTTTDDQTRLARSRAKGWREVALANLPAAVAADKIDILIDLSGHTAGGALMQFARRMAPVQVSFLGYPGSTGVPNVDWLIGDPVVTPPEADGLCSERVMRLPDTVFCYAPEVEYPLPDFARAAQGRPMTFGSFNNIPKLTPRTIALWAQVMAAVPEAQLLLRAPSFGDAAATARFRRLFADAGVDPARLVFKGPVGLDQMMASYAEVDVALDPLPYGGGTTTLQALWMGVPVVTLAGGHFVSRMGASFLQAAGLPDWVAQTDAEYVACAVRAASDHAALLALKQGLRARLMARPAWDADRYVESFGEALRQIWQQTMGA